MKRDRTQMGGANEFFRTTRWTDIVAARTADPQRRRQAVGAVAERYWKPVYCFLRRKGLSNEQAKDAVQGFFQHVLQHDLIQQADKARGRFRSFLLTALRNYVASAARRQRARKRMPEGGLVSLDGLQGPALPEPHPQATAEEAFVHAWAAGLLDEVLNEVRDRCLAAGQEKHWQVFQQTVLAPIRSGLAPPPLADLCRALGIESQKRASNMAVTVKRRCRAVLLDRIRQSVDSDDDVQAELGDLMNALSKGGAAA